MSLEDLTGNKYINSLVSTNPVGSTDTKSQGDDHIRGIKNILLKTFPNLTGPVTATQAELNILDGVTATAAELNILDGVTATAAELNRLDGVTATTAELNILDGVTATAAELNILDGVTATAAELNILDGVTATAAELNRLDGVTATTAELNILDGVTATAAELNILDGRTLTSTDDKIDAFPAGTDTVFYQAAAPTGWIKSTANNDAALRVVSGSSGGSAGGTHGLSSPPSTAHVHSTLSHALTTAELPAHTHPFVKAFDIYDAQGSIQADGAITKVVGATVPIVRYTHTGSEGSGSAHSHGNTVTASPTQFSPKYVDVIICSKS
jgi:hypothetical protein